MENSSGTSNEDPRLNDWIGTGKIYKDVPHFITEMLLQKLSMLEEQSIFPSSTLSIHQLLATHFSLQIQPIQLVSPSDCFSDIEPNTDLNDLLHRSIPSNVFLTRLRDMAGQAMLDGKRSIKDWTRKDVYLPFSALTFWYSLLRAAISKKAWQNAQAWLTKQKIPPDLLSRINHVFASTSWADSISSLGSFVTVADMALFLSPEMLSESHIDAMLSRLRVRIQAFHPNPDSIFIALTDFTQSLTTIPSYQNSYPMGATTSLLRTASQFLTNGTAVKDIWAVAYSEPIHFGTLHLQKLKDDDGLKINWGDSIGRSQPKTMTQGLKTWISHHNPHSQLRFFENLERASQTDSYSCSIISVNTIKHALFGDTLWSQNTREILHIQEFLDVMEFHVCLSNLSKLRNCLY